MSFKEPCQILVKTFNCLSGRNAVRLIALALAIDIEPNIARPCRIIAWEIIYTMKNVILVKNVRLRKISLKKAKFSRTGRIGLNGLNVQLYVEVGRKSEQECVIQILANRKNAWVKVLNLKIAMMKVAVALVTKRTNQFYFIELSF